MRVVGIHDGFATDDGWVGLHVEALANLGHRW